MRIIDLTLPIHTSIPAFPGDPKLQITLVHSLERDGANLSAISMSTHFSTHIDAPCHFILGGKRIDDYPVERFIARGVVLDVRGQQTIDTSLRDDHLAEAVLFLTGHNTRVAEPDYLERYPVIGLPTAQRLVEKGVKLVGIDSFTVDAAPHEVHRLLLSKDILIVENLANLESLLGQPFTLFALPLRLPTEGSPCRVVVVVDEVRQSSHE